MSDGQGCLIVWGLGGCLIVWGLGGCLIAPFPRVAALSGRPLMGSVLSLPDPGSALESIRDPAFRCCPARLLAYPAPLRRECPASELEGRHLSRQHAQHSQTSIWECSQLDWERRVTIYVSVHVNNCAARGSVASRKLNKKYFHLWQNSTSSTKVNRLCDSI